MARYRKDKKYIFTGDLPEELSQNAGMLLNREKKMQSPAFMPLLLLHEVDLVKPDRGRKMIVAAIRLQKPAQATVMFRASWITYCSPSLCR
jgi:hypothetical protein